MVSQRFKPSSFFGCAANFYGNHGECMHQDLVKTQATTLNKDPVLSLPRLLSTGTSGLCVELADAAIHRADSANYTTDYNVPVKLGTKINKWQVNSVCVSLTLVLTKHHVVHGQALKRKKRLHAVLMDLSCPPSLPTLLSMDTQGTTNSLDTQK